MQLHNSSVITDKYVSKNRDIPWSVSYAHGDSTTSGTNFTGAIHNPKKWIYYYLDIAPDFHVL